MLPVTVEEVEFQDGEYLPKVTEPQSPVPSGPAGQSQDRVAGADNPRKGWSSCAVGPREEGVKPPQPY